MTFGAAKPATADECSPGLGDAASFCSLAAISAAGLVTGCASRAVSCSGREDIDLRSKWGICSDIQGRECSSFSNTPRSVSGVSFAVTCVNEGGVTDSLPPS